MLENVSKFIEIDIEFDFMETRQKMLISPMFSPLRRTRPSTLFSSLSADLADFGFNFRNSSQSPRITFMCLSKALNWPMNVRES